MTRSAWIRRFLTVFTGAFLVLAGVAVLRGRSTREALAHGLMWGSISALIFTGSRSYQSGNGRFCALCAAAPERRP